MPSLQSQFENVHGKVKIVDGKLELNDVKRAPEGCKCFPAQSTWQEIQADLRLASVSITEDYGVLPGFLRWETLKGNNTALYN